jgi:Uma2 family endonuclease
MSISLRSTTPTGPDVEPAGHNYRLSDDQFRRTIEAGIITDTDGVELRDGFLCRKSDPDDAHAERHYRLSVDQYRAMVRQDIFTTDDRIELLEGWLVAKMTKHPPHEIAKGLTQDLLIPLTPAGWFVAIEGPTDTVDSEPEPDLMIVRGSRRDYREGSPGPGDVALVVEVADSSLSRDRSMKKRLYARSGYPIYWLINLVANRIEVYTDPTGPTEKPDYLRRQDFGPDEMIPLVIEGREVGRLAVRDLLP